ncbi:MAG TPA: uracil-DNA glycosylase [Candidatus Krumholzibacteria bacterium]|nr:uracil-DNA glycosylase [Candidatus Krumholzibacteria bacterium]
MSIRNFRAIQRAIVDCDRCPRLRAHCAKVAAERRKQFADQQYWGRPVPSFGDPRARMMIVGLAPAAHGANRTGRMFTGDSSGDWLYEALHRYGFASQARSVSADDGLELDDCLVSAAVHCAPPQNKPTREEQDTCRHWLHREIDELDPELVIVLGRIAWDAWLRLLDERGVDLPSPRPEFAHDRFVEIDRSPLVLQSYHPSRQNTNTGRLTRRMWHAVFRRARRHLDSLD